MGKQVILNEDIEEKPVDDLADKLEKKDSYFALAMMLMGFLYWNLIKLFALGAGTTIFALLLFGCTFIYLSKSGYQQNRGSIICLLLAFFSAMQFSIFDNRFVAFLNFIFISLLFVYWVCLTTKRRIDKELSIYILGDGFLQMIITPFTNFIETAKALSLLSKNKRDKGALAGLLGIVIFLPFIIMVISLLVSADLAFENFVNGALKNLNMGVFAEYFWHFLLGLPVAFYLFGMIYGNIKKDKTVAYDTEKLDQIAMKVRIAPEVMLYTVLSIFNIIYLTFFIVQAVYLFSAFSSNLPGEFTYAEYARRGFFELCGIATINLVILSITQLVVKREIGEEPKILCYESIGIGIFTLLLISTALSKMVMYIDAFGLTRWRVYTSWFMLLLFFVFLVIVLRQIKKFNATKITIIGFLLLFMPLLYGNVDGGIAKYNLYRYKNGTLQDFDYGMLSQLSADGRYYLYKFYSHEDFFDKSNYEVVKAVRNAISYESYWEKMEFRTFNYYWHLSIIQSKDIQKDLK